MQASLGRDTRDPDRAAAPTDAGEAARLARLRALVVLDTPPEAVFDDLARMASEVCGTPIALLSLVDAERQWFKANVGLPGVGETPRDVAFCAHALAADALLEVPDATRDGRFARNPLVLGQPGIRFYAGAPLVMPGGERVGTLCVIDREERTLDAAQRRTLASLGRIAAGALVMRQQLIDKSLAVRSSYERALVQSEARHRALIEEQADFVSLARRDGRLLYVNPSYAQHFGRTPADMAGADLHDFVAAEDRVEVMARLEDVWQTGRTLSAENRMVSASGVERWVAWTNRLQKDPDGETLLHSVGRDITDKKLAERALRESQAFLARTERVAGIGGWQLDLGSGALVWSAETRRIHEVADDFEPTLERAVGFYTPESQPLIDAAVQRAMRDGASWDLELRLVTARGRSIWARAQGEAEVEDGRVVRLSGAFQDITERKALQLQLADSDRLIRQITDALPLRIAYLDRELRYRFVNRGHCERFGLPRELIVGRRRDELAGRADPARERHIRAALDGAPQRFEFVERHEGRERRIECNLVPDVDESGRVAGLYSTGVDVTARVAAEDALRMLTAIIDTTPDFVVQADRQGAVTYLNPAVRRALGMSADEPVGTHNVSEFNTPETNRLFAETIVPAVAEHGAWLGRTVVYVAGRRELPVSHMVIGHRDASGRIERYSAVMRDVSAEVEAQRDLQRQTATLASMIEAMPAVVAVAGADQRYRFVNDAYERWFGKPREACIGRTLAEVLGPADYARTAPFVRRVLAGETVEFEKEYAAADGARFLKLHYLPLHLDGRIDGFFATAHDVTSSRREASRLSELAQHDALTGLLNRTGFETFLQRRLEAGEGAQLAALYIDLDRFKPVNDAHGHAAGDRVLREVGERLRRFVRPSDAVARLGGDEFAMVLCGVREAAHAQLVADKAIAAIGEPIDIGGCRIEVGASIGLAFGAGQGWQEMLARADARLYKAKKAGRGRSAGVSDFLPF